MLFAVAGESQSCHKGQCRRCGVVSCWQGAEHQIQDPQVNFYTHCTSESIFFIHTFLFAGEFLRFKFWCKSSLKAEWVARCNSVFMNVLKGKNCLCDTIWGNHIQDIQATQWMTW